jgi:excinuclease UvrABC helicase subunit UvrB
MDFQLVTNYKLRGDRPRAIGELMAGLAAGEKHQVLLGVTGSGKTFTMVNEYLFDTVEDEGPVRWGKKDRSI